MTISSLLEYFSDRVVLECRCDSEVVVIRRNVVREDGVLDVSYDKGKILLPCISIYLFDSGFVMNVLGSENITNGIHEYSNMSRVSDGVKVRSYMSHEHWEYQPEMSSGDHTGFACFGIMMLVMSMAGNMSVMFLFYRFRSLRTYSNLFVLNLTVADFIMAVGNIPMLVISSVWGHWLFGEAGCRAYAFIGSTASFVSINTLAVIALDRCLVIVRTIPGHNRMTRRSFILVIVSIWTYAILWATGPLFGFGNYILEGTNTSCTFDFLTRTTIVRGYVVSIFTAHFIIPLAVIAVSYSLIFRAISKFKHEFLEATKVYGENELPLHMRKSDKGYSHEAKTARVTLTVILVFCVSWMPYAIVAMIGEFGDISQITRLVAGIPCLLAKCSTIINPVVYALLHPKFRTKLINFGACTQSEEDRRQEEYRRTVVHFRSRKQSSV